MSVTTTSNPITYASAAVLRDYELTHSSSDDSLDTSLNAHPAPSSQSNPADWPTEHRRIPAYRPVNTELDQSERRVYQNPIERVFIGTMFTGVFLQSRQRYGARLLGEFGMWVTSLVESGEGGSRLVGMDGFMSKFV